MTKKRAAVVDETIKTRDIFLSHRSSDKDIVRKDTLRMLRAAIQRREVDERTELDEQQVVTVVEKLVKQARDSIAQFEQGGRQDLADKEKGELEIMLGYLPEQLSAEEIDQHIRAAIEETGASSMKDMGKVMGKLKPILQGKADKQIADDLRISPATVRTHMRRLFAKYELNDRLELTLLVLKTLRGQAEPPLPPEP